jgi:RNA 3'-terminal phosphate cyclase (ATP)
VRCGAPPLTLHTRTAIAVAEQLTGARFRVEEADGGKHVLVTCEGAGHSCGAAAD